MSNKTLICLWYESGAEDAAKFYAETFPDSSVGKTHASPADNPSAREGAPLTVDFTVLGLPCLGLNGGPHFKQSEAFSFQVITEDQEETDRYWNAIVGNGGEESMCGWCKDKWGVSWQITPRYLAENMDNPDKAASRRVFEAMMKMKKIDIATLKAAAEAETAEPEAMGRRIIGGAFVSLDGVMQAPGGPGEDESGGFEYGGWLAGLYEEVIGNQVDTLFHNPCDLLLGRRTYDIFASYWPFQPMDQPIAALFARVNKFVLTRSGEPLEWQGSHRLASLDDLATLKAEDGPDLVIQGSSTLYPQLLERGLLDRLVLMVAPVTLGKGKRLFGEGTPAGTFRPVEQRIGPNGCVVSTYEPAGPLETGTFVTQEPSELELERRKKVEAGTW